MNFQSSYTDLLSLMNRRFSCRGYDTERVVGRDHIEAVLEAARVAPSACNRQPWKFLVANTDEARNVVVESYNRDWIRTAPAFIIAIGDHGQAWHRADGKDHTDVDLSIAIEHICLAATALGLGTCWVCNFDAAIIRSGFNLPADLEPIAIIPIGYPATDCTVAAKNRKSADDIIVWGKF